MIEIVNLNKHFSEKKTATHAVNNVSFTVDKGEIVGIIGHSGAGKSTLIRLLNRLIEPDSGFIAYDGIDLAKLKRKDLAKMRQNIGMIFQNINLMWSKTVYKNIEFALQIAGIPKNARKERVIELISLVGLKGKETMYPAKLSGGERQRVAISRALANNPHVLLCDEATSALDPETAQSILDLLKKINKELGITIVFITHQMEVIRKICDRVIVMENGKIIESGKVIDVFQYPKTVTTKTFIKEILDDSLAVNSPHPVYKIVYQGQQREQPILSQALKKFDVEMNILHGKMTTIGDQSIGFLYINLYGHDQASALAYLNEQGLEVMTHV